MSYFCNSLNRLLLWILAIANGKLQATLIYEACKATGPVFGINR